MPIRGISLSSGGAAKITPHSEYSSGSTPSCVAQSDEEAVVHNKADSTEQQKRYLLSPPPRVDKRSLGVGLEQLLELTVRADNTSREKTTPNVTLAYPRAEAGNKNASTIDALGATEARFRQRRRNYVTAYAKRYIATIVACCWLYATCASFKSAREWLSPLCIQSNVVDCGCSAFSWMGFSTAIRRGSYYLYPCILFVMIHHTTLTHGRSSKRRSGQKSSKEATVNTTVQDRPYFTKDLIYPLVTCLLCIIFTYTIITAAPQHPYLCLIPCSFCLLAHGYLRGPVMDGLRATIPLFAVSFFMQVWNVMSLSVLMAITKGLGWSVLFYASSPMAAAFMLFTKALFLRLHLYLHIPLSEVGVFAIGTFCTFWADSYVESIRIYYVNEGIRPLILISLTSAMVDLIDKSQLLPRFFSAVLDSRRRLSVTGEQIQIDQTSSGRMGEEEMIAKQHDDVVQKPPLEQIGISSSSITGPPMNGSITSSSCDANKDASASSSNASIKKAKADQKPNEGPLASCPPRPRESVIKPSQAAVSILPEATQPPNGNFITPRHSQAVSSKGSWIMPSRSASVTPRRFSVVSTEGVGWLTEALSSTLQQGGTKGPDIDDSAVVAEAAAVGFKVRTAQDLDEYITYRNVGKTWNWVTFGHEFHITMCSIILQLLQFSPTGMTAEGDCTGNNIVRVMNFPMSVVSYSVFLIPAFTRLLMGYLIPLVVFKRKWLGTSLHMANPAPNIPIIYLILIYAAASHNAFHQFEVMVRFACIGRRDDPCIPIIGSSTPSL